MQAEWDGPGPARPPPNPLAAVAARSYDAAHSFFGDLPPEEVLAMRPLPRPRRVALLATVATLFAFVLAARSWPDGPSERPAQQPVDGRLVDNARSWPLFGGSAQRNMVNTRDTGLPADWDVTPGVEKNVKWSVPLGTRPYGGPGVSRRQNYRGHQ